RRHTSFSRDWSSDVCSSDLATDVLYVPVGSRLTLSSPQGGRFAIATAVAAGGHPVALVRAEDVPVEIRGGGNMTRKVRNFGAVRSEERRVGEVVEWMMHTVQ